MRILAIISLFVFFASLQINSFAQSKTTSFMYEKETSFGLMPHTRGFGASVQFTKHRTADNFRLFDINFYSVKHPKEIKLPNPDVTNSRPYVFGKLNSLYNLKVNYGARRILADKLAQNSVRINFNYSAGPVLGILKPVYYDVKVAAPDYTLTQKRRERFDEENKDMQLNTIGYANFGYGIGESTFMFGANAKTSFSFEWGREDNKFYSLETGVMVDAFTKDVPIFAYIKNDKAFINLFLTFSYGTRR